MPKREKLKPKKRTSRIPNPVADMTGPLHDLSQFDHVIMINTYPCVYLPGHPRSSDTGYISLSRLVMENKLGRRLRSRKLVYHLDGNRLNCNPINLSFKRPRSIKERECPVCHKRFQPAKNAYLRCSPKCGQKARRKTRPTKAELKEMVWSMPTSQLAVRLGVSDVAIAKWCKEYKIKKPPRGYWRKNRQPLECGTD